MMKWDKVGNWIKDNAGTGAALVGSLITGNVPGAVAAGVSIVSSVTGTNDPEKALEQLQNDPQTLIELKRMAHEEEKSIRSHIESMERMRLEDEQASHSETQETIRTGDTAEGWIVRLTRPVQSTASLIAGISYGLMNPSPDIVILSAFLALPGGYMGFRHFGKRDALMSIAGTLGSKKNG